MGRVGAKRGVRDASVFLDGDRPRASKEIDLLRPGQDDHKHHHGFTRVPGTHRRNMEMLISTTRPLEDGCWQAAPCLQLQTSPRLLVISEE